MKIIGVTGGVGAGKSTVLDYLEKAYGAKLILADLVGHEVMEPGMEAYDRILETFGTAVQDETGRIDRRALAGIVFADEKLLQKLNAIVHPAVKEEILRRIFDYQSANESYVVVEAALFLEENYDAFCDETWYIYASEEHRRARLRSSRGYSDERITQILKSQKRHEEFQSRCDFTVDNNGTEEETHRQIDKRMRE